MTILIADGPCTVMTHGATYTLRRGPNPIDNDEAAAFIATLDGISVAETPAPAPMPTTAEPTAEPTTRAPRATR